MIRSLSLRTAVAATLVTTGLLGLGTTNANAGGPSRQLVINNLYPAPVQPHCVPQVPPPCTYQTVIEYEVRPVQQVDWVVRYHSCGQPYKAKVVRTRTVKVPVERRIQVCIVP